ncbi:pH-response regulator protein palF/RIM8 [Sarocladium implicatum]|nr:pH-response regulator protein palF/RIM8 [Sarocladium implicatum]
MPRPSSSASLSLPNSPLPASSPGADATSPAPSGELPVTPSSSTSTASVHTTTPSTTSARRSKFWSLLSIPKSFSSAQRNRYLADFHVNPNEPHRKYNPGDHVHGSVAVTVLKPVRITHLVVTLHGFVKVVRDPSTVSKSMANAQPIGGNAGPQYHGNGHASLFQDEQVLSGEGRLEPGKYDFGFDLLFPSEGLPSSIDFERGTVSYLITATITRPNAITPVVCADRKIYLVHQCDVGSIPAPRPQTIWLEPTRKTQRGRRKRSMVVDKAALAAPEVTDLGSEPDHAEATPDATTPHPHHSNASREHQSESQIRDQSDMRSEISGESGRSTSTGLSRAEMSQLTHVSTGVTSAAKQQEVNDKTISATVEVSKGGFVPGDTVPVRISIRHNKHMKSMSGIIVTLFRQGSIELSPSPSAFDEVQENQLMETNKVMPRARIGLGGFSSTGSSMVFRKDLDQNTVPLIIDPLTLTSNMTVSVKLPDESFPTIKDVPGDMIRFTYQIEVIMDLGGRMANAYHAPHSSRIGPLGSTASEMTNASYGPRRGASIADTAHIRRMEGVFSCALAIIVGTTDSTKTRRRKKSFARMPEGGGDDYENGNDLRQTSSHHMSEQPIDSYFPPLPNGHDMGPPLPMHPAPPNHGPTSAPAMPPYSQTNGHISEASPVYVPPPQIPNEQGMSEKERIRQAETRLLPSQPPAGESSSAPAEDDIYDAEDTPRLQASSLTLETPPGERDISEGPSAPTADDLVNPGLAAPAHLDKQELERQRLINEASAPPEFPEDMDRRADGPSRSDHAASTEPSAPVLNEEDEYAGYGVGAGPSAPSAHHLEQLPAYER